MATQSTVAKLTDYLRKYGPRDTGERVVGALLRSTFGSILRRHAGTPSFADIHFAAQLTTASPEELLKALDPEVSSAFIEGCRSEFASLSEQLQSRKRDRELHDPLAYGVESNTAFLLYVLVRAYRPSVVLETGVANGESTFFLLSALHANGVGRLHSVDVSRQVGSLLREAEKREWTLHVADGSKAGFREVLETIPAIDLFIHDSDHSYWWQSFELQSALGHVSPGGIIASDDCDKSYAFLDFCASLPAGAFLLHDSRKVFGLVGPRGRRG